MNRKKIYSKIFVAFISLLLIGVIFLLGLEIANANRVARGIKVANLNLGGLKFGQAEMILKEQAKQWQENDLIIKNENKIWLLKPKELGIKLAIDQTLKQTFQIGRQKNILIGLSQQIKAIGGGYHLSLIFKTEQSYFSNFIDKQLKPIEKPSQSADLIYNPSKDDFDLTDSQIGLIVDKKKLREDLAERAHFLSSLPIELSLIKEEPQIADEEALKTHQEISKILENIPFRLKHQDKIWSINKKMALDWLSFLPEDNHLKIILSQEKIEEYLTTLSPNINQAAQNAQLTFENNQIIISRQAQNKIELKIKENIELITKSILDSSVNGQKEIPLLVESWPAQVRAETIEQLGISSFLGQGSSNFSGSPKNRIHNIKIGAARFDEALLKPNEEFSFNTILGEIGPQQGYLAELVIKKNKTIPEYGGGLCQVSTTMFRAAVNSGLKITERFAHSFAVKYYNPQGFDATIYPPHPDLKFVNDTPNNIFIQSKVQNNQITFEIFGTDDGREIKIIGPYIWEQKEDGSMKATLTQKIYKDEELLRQKTFYSNYKSPDLYPVERNPLE